MTENVTINYRHFFQKTLESMPWPIFVIDRALTISFYNHHAAHLFEATKPLQGKSLQGKKLDQFIQNPEIIQLIQESIQTGHSHSGKYDTGSQGTTWKISVTPLEHKKLPAVPKHAQSPPAVRREEQAYHYFAIAIEDLTELRRLERVRHDFIANVSHELRTPLASVRLLTETLEEAIDTDPDMAQSFVEKIETEVQYLTSLVSELLELARIESGQVPMMIEPVSAEQLIREGMARLLPQAQRHRVQLHTEIHDGQSLVAADSRQIGRALVNLMHNAIKFTPSGGQVVVGTMLQPGGQTQRFFVRDTGVGIRPEDLPRIFERFYKVDRARSKADFPGGGGGGSGLGLAIARHVVEAHGGRLSAESSVGQGSTFAFTLPVAVRGPAI